MTISSRISTLILACCLSALTSCTGDASLDSSGPPGGTGGTGGAGGADGAPGGEGGAGGVSDEGKPPALDLTGRWTSSEFEDPFEAQLTQAADGTLSGTVCGPGVTGDNCGTVTNGKISGHTVQFSYGLPWPDMEIPIDYDFEGTASPEAPAARIVGQLSDSYVGGPREIVWTACPGTERCP
ncbi:uncharacterized protein SOCE26_065040 [Sorangium cellulosum]|uniref:Secreted protein n=1 Tax=Sorangium cellulosum TaxID=56 RepID=A0A2L0F0H4_SORCE|nr:hypothetical protein [Sorangium cellulosum]AUX45023.1 uncharacterized protein SOCE26_065040 [Sorangium cellulosum]